MRVGVIVFDGFDELDAIAPYEVLRAAAKSDPSLDVQLVALGAPRTLEAAHGVRLEVAEPLAGHFDWLIVPGGGWASGAIRGVRPEIAAGALLAVLREAHASGTKIASVCTGAMLLSAAGLLRGRPCTTHAVARETLASEGGTLVDARVVDDDDVVTAGGVTSGIDLALHLIARWHGPEAAARELQRLEHPHVARVHRSR